MRVIATAGHVDHGKSTLIEALTGTDPDRWAEEKTRGLTIDLGFAATTLPSGEEIGFVDVPGHGRFVKNMLAGVGSVDACLFVVAATDGWKAQSEEHLRILELVGLTHGVVALTKVGLVDEEWSKLAAMEVQDHLEGTFLGHAEMVEVDAPSGVGLEELRLALGRLVDVVPPSPDRERPRLWVDRSFSVRGSGTVVTGTLTGGSVSVGDELVVEPGGHQAGVRALQSHYTILDRASPGRRLALNMSGIAREQVQRGQALVRQGQWHLSATFDAELNVLHSIEHPVGNRGAYVVYVGSAELPARMRLIGRRQADPGDTVLSRFWLKGGAGIPIVPGDRYVLREAGRFETVGGGQVLDVEPILPTSKAHPDRSVERVVKERGWVDSDHLARLTGQWTEPTVGKWVVDSEALGRTRELISERCKQAGKEGLALATLDKRERAVVSRGIPGIEVRADRLVDSSLASDALSRDAARVLAGLEAAKWSPEAPSNADRPALRELERRGLAVQAGDEWFAGSAVQAAMQVFAQLLEAKPDGFTVSEARDALGSTRKHVVPLLTYLDSIGATRRRGDQRIAGPRLGARV